ncbi:hypothetical protein AXI59_15595 [Bacillus nakamurai]|uniref:DUF3037 domain-containing protein n=1 Tax=Bacillus nakamurai TaxID=1793963 RepID=UPI000778414C|nr:DUF3037 domain-containing protein [Bacillus nakamurai]KXZ18958.1 hypothetical protein AXI59_15595 [Bacillus nakamurai]
MDRRKACWYSVVRYQSDQLAGEVVNVGVILHTLDGDVPTMFYLVEETSPKLRSLIHSPVDANLYKSFKDALEYYLIKSQDNILGQVGSVIIGSQDKKTFLDDLYDYYKDKKLTLSRPKFSLADDLKGFLEAIFNVYVGKGYMQKQKTHSIKKQMRSIFEERRLLEKKVMHDFSIEPIEGLESVKIKIDFGYKNGVWNYLQSIPIINGNTKKTEWFAKTKFLYENAPDGAKIHLLYRKSDLDQSDIKNELNYLENMDNRIIRFDLENQQKIIELCNTIEREAHDIDSLKIS